MVNRATLQLRRWMGPSRCRHDAEWQLASIDRHHAEGRLDAAVRTLEARGHDIAGALRTRDAAERSLIHLVMSGKHRGPAKLALPAQVLGSPYPRRS